MGVFRQLGDPVCPDCLCEHHGAAYCELTPPAEFEFPTLCKDTVDDNTTIVSCQIVTTKQCCIVVNAATFTPTTVPPTALEIERPFGTIRTTQEDAIDTGTHHLMHHAAWEVLPAGTYTYFLVNRAGAVITHNGAWLKIIASDCEG